MSEKNVQTSSQISNDVPMWLVFLAIATILANTVPLIYVGINASATQAKNLRHTTVIPASVVRVMDQDITNFSLAMQPLDGRTTSDEDPISWQYKPVPVFHGAPPG
jgi:hypothetical protein